VAFCIHCGANNQPDAVFCLSCGRTLYQTPQKGGLARIRDLPGHWLIIFGFISIAIVALILVFSVKDSGNPNRSVSSPLKEGPKTNAPLGEAVLTVIGVNSTGSPASQGSGFILSSDGLAGSNYHVLKGVAQATAECCNGRIFEIRSIEGADLAKDLVVFQLYERGNSEKPQDLPHVTLGSSTDLAVGEKVIAIGSPQGLENTVSDGILSAIREYDSVRYLQITAPISPGSSGGPVLNASGHMVGVATFQFERGQNLNFAVAAEHLRPLLGQHFQISLVEFQSIVKQAQHTKHSTGTAEAVDAPSQDPRPTTPPMTGQFGGIVHNQSVNVSAEFGIVVQDADGVLSGCMGLKQPLFGSGPLVGFIAGSEVSFIVRSAIGKITFVGQRREGSVNGTYIVEHESSPSEEGTFTLRRVKSDGPGTNLDMAKCPTDAEMNQ